MTLPRVRIPFSVLLILLIAMITAALGLVSYKLANEASNLTASQHTLSMSTETLQSIRRMLSSARLVTRLTSHSTLTQQEDLESRLSQLGFIKEALSDSPTISAITAALFPRSTANNARFGSSLQRYCIGTTQQLKEAHRQIETAEVDPEI